MLKLGAVADPLQRLHQHRWDQGADIEVDRGAELLQLIEGVIGIEGCFLFLDQLPVKPLHIPQAAVVVAGDALQPKGQLRATETFFRQLLQDLLQRRLDLRCSSGGCACGFNGAAPPAGPADQAAIAAQGDIGVVMPAITLLDRGQHPIPLVLDGQGRHGLLDQLVRTAAVVQPLLIEQVDPAVHLLHKAGELGAAVHSRPLTAPVGAATIQHFLGLAADQLRQCRNRRRRGLRPLAYGSLLSLPRLRGRPGRFGPGIDAHGPEVSDLNQAVGVLGIDQLVAAGSVAGRGTDTHPGAGQDLTAVLPARNGREIAVQLPRRGAPAGHPVSWPHVNVDPTAGRALNAALCELRTEIQQAHPVLIQSLLGWIVLAIKINDHHILRRDDGEPDRPPQTLGDLKAFQHLKFISRFALACQSRLTIGQPETRVLADKSR